MGLTKPRAYQIYNLDYKQSVRVVTITNITLTAGAPSTVDGVALSLNDRILVTGQSTGSQNGIYYVTTLGTGSNGTWARSIDTNETGELDSGTIVMVTEGTVYADTQWKLTTNDPITIGSTALTFVQNYLANSISAGTSNVVVASNANVTISSAGTANVLTVSSTGTVTSGTASVTGNINTVGALNINSTDGNYNVLNISGTALAPYGTPQTWKFFTNNIALGSSGSWILFPDSSQQTTAYPGTASALSLTGNITGGNLLTSGLISATGNITGGNILTAGIMSSTGNATHGNILTGGLVSATGNVTGGNLTTAGQVSATANITGGNILTVGQVSATGTITTAAGTNSTGFAVGNGAVSNVGLGFFPTAGTRGDYAIRDYSNVTSTMYLDVGMGGSAAGEFQFRTSNAYTLLMRANTTGVYATGNVYGTELNSTNSQANEGGQINLALPSSGSTLSTSVIIDLYQNKLRFFEGGGTNRGAYIDLTSANASVGTNLLAAGGGGGTPGGSNTYVQFNDGGLFGGVAGFTFDKTSNVFTANIVASTNNGNGTNFKVGDDAWIGDINTADTIRIAGQQNAANAYIVFGNTNATALGRAGSGPLTYSGAFSATGNIDGGNLRTAGLVSATGNIDGGNLRTAGLISATGNVNGGNVISSALVQGVTVSASGNVIGGNVTTAGLISATGNITGGNILGGANVNATTHTGTTVSVTANITGGNILTSGLISATGNITGGNILGGANVNATTHTGTTVSVTANITGGNILTAGQLISSVATGTAPLVITSTTKVTNLNVEQVDGFHADQAGTANTIVVRDASGYANVAGLINAGANGVGNIGSSTLYFNTAFIKATSAQYADLAEMYVADQNYPAGTVVEFGGEFEITQTTHSCSTAVAGIISTNPSYLMNSAQPGEYVLPVALTGRVPCQVLGPVKKGDVLVSSNIPGVAQRIGANWQPGCTVGKSMETIADSTIQTIEVAVGRL